MPLPIAIPVAISAIKALIRFREQVDTILSLNEASSGLPFALPTPPTDDAPHLENMLAFFKTEQGHMILQLQGLEGDFAVVAEDPTSILPGVSGRRSRLFKLYYDAAGVQPTHMSPYDPANRAIKGLETADMRLAYYVVQSQRLSHNPALVRVLLATADTLLEFAGENANLFISNPQTRSLVENLIDEFAGKRDFTDDGAEEIFKSLLGATIVAFANNPPVNLANKPALKVLFAALGDVRQSLGNDFVAKIISVDGFEQLVAVCATEVAKDPSFLTSNALAQHVLTATLTQIGKKFPNIIEDPKALLGVLEVGIGAAAANVPILLQGELAGQPLLAAVLAGILNQVSRLALSNHLFDSLAKGQFRADLYKITLQAIAANPIKFGNQDDVEKFVSDLIVGLANALAQHELSKLFTIDTLHLIASESLTVLAADPLFLTGHNQFATKLLAAVFKASAIAVADVLTQDDLLDIATAAIKAATDNIALLNLNDQLSAVITVIGEAIATSGLLPLLNAQRRKELILSVLETIAANPTVWSQLQDKDLIQPLVQAILQGLATDPTHLLSGPVLIDAVSRILQAAVRHGQQCIDLKVKADDVKKLLTMSLDWANREIGRAVDGNNLPIFLERVFVAFLKAPFAIMAAPPSVGLKKLVDTVLAGLNQ